MRQYKVWSETYDQNEEDGREIEAGTPQQAAEKWTWWYDIRSADFMIVNGNPATVAVKDIDTGHVSIWLVHGEAVRVYTAKLRVSADPLIEKLDACPACGSNDISWCNISVRPYCNECGHWGRVNYGGPLDAVKAWNKATT